MRASAGCRACAGVGKGVAEAATSFAGGLVDVADAAGNASETSLLPVSALHCEACLPCAVGHAGCGMQQWVMWLGQPCDCPCPTILCLPCCAVPAVGGALDTVADAFRGRRRRLLADVEPAPAPTPTPAPATAQGIPVLPPPLVVAAAGAAPGGAPAPLAEGLMTLDSDNLSSPLPFYAALLRPTLLPVLPAGNAPADAQQRRQLLGQIADRLTPLVEQASGQCWGICWGMVRGPGLCQRPELLELLECCMQHASRFLARTCTPTG